jgi:putative ABC transport system ATP-binding protein
VSLIHLEGLSKVYRVGDQEIKALSDINLRIEEGEFLSIIGSSGSGKSTLMHLLGCLDTPTTGRMEICGKDLAKATGDELARVRNREIGFVFQSFNLLPKLDVISNIALPLIYAGVPHAQRLARAKQAAVDVGLGDRLANRPPQLSGGQCQRVAIARALVNNPRILFADEPTGNLDSATGRIILEIFDSLHAAGKTVVLVTHDPSIAARSRRIIEIQDGSITREYAP